MTSLADGATTTSVVRERPLSPAVAAPSGVELRQATELFGISIATATRPEMRRALAAKGAMLKSSQGSFDVYDSQKLLDESKELEVGYVSDGHFGRARYTLRSFLDTAQVARVAGLVKQKYGAPAESEGDVNLGRVSFRWLLDDGVLVVVRRGWPDTTTFLEYLHPIHAPQLDAELAKGRAAERAEAFQRQADAL